MRLGVFMAIAGDTGQTEIIGCRHSLTRKWYDMIYMAADAAQCFRS